MRRTQSHQTDHRTGASRRLSDFGISGGARICGRHCAARESQKTIHFLIKSHQGTGKQTYAGFYPNTDFHFELSEELKEQTWKSKPRSAWEKVKAVRQVERPSALDYMDSIFDIFVEAHGDRGFADDKALIGGIGFIEGSL